MSTLPLTRLRLVRGVGIPRGKVASYERREEMMMDTAHKVIEDVSLRSLAREAMEKAKNDVRKAHPIFLAALKAQGKVYKELVDLLVERVCLDELHQVIRRDRATIWDRAEAAHTAASAERVAALARSNLMSFVLPNGKRLASATRAECMRYSEDYLKQGKTMCHMGRWMRLIGQSVSDGRTVQKVLSEERLHELREEAKENGNE